MNALNYIHTYLSLSDMLLLSFGLFSIGTFGLVFNKRNLLTVLLSIEILLLSANLNFVFFSINLNDITGIIVLLFILLVAAAESSIGLAMLVSQYKLKNNIDIEKFHELKS